MTNRRFLLLLLLSLFMLIGCEKNFSPDKNYVYTFSALVHKDEWGIETWGAHQFVTDNEITNIEKFKECYVNYLKWSGKDKDGLYNQIFYSDHKKVKITYLRETYNLWTVKSNDNCVE